MQTHADNPILFRNTMRISEGHLDGFKSAIEQAVDFVEKHGPQLMVEVFIDEVGMLAYSFQLYSDSDAIRAHWQMSDPCIRGVMEHCTVQSLEVYGQPDESVMRSLQSDSMGAIPVTVTPQFTGYVRLPG